MKAKEKPAYQSPKVSSLDYKESALGSIDQVDCESGSNATGNCTDTGNIAIAFCADGNDGVKRT